MKKKIYLIPKDDLVKYPPTISLINTLLDLGCDIECIGIYSDEIRRKLLEEKGVKFVSIFRKTNEISKNRYVNWIVFLYRVWKYKRSIKNYFSKAEVTNNDVVWFVYSFILGSIHKYFDNFNFVVQFYEFEDYSLGGRIRILHPNYKVSQIFGKARALIHCEYNRAMITNGLYGLKNPPVILPNKPFEKEDETYGDILPADINDILEDLKIKTQGKKVILYQGIFDSKERRLEEFCEAIDLLPEDYLFIAMGGKGGYFDEIKIKYSSNKILYIPFIRPPYHLLVTKIARYGVLTYHPAGLNYVDVINPLYCAPNKIFEFGKFGIPMIANDVPGLKMIFESYQCGTIISSPLESSKIATAIMNMETSYDSFSKNARSYYDSIDIKNIVLSVLNNC